VRSEYLQAALHERKNYGDIETYFSKGLGLESVFTTPSVKRSSEEA